MAWIDPRRKCPGRYRLFIGGTGPRRTGAAAPRGVQAGLGRQPLCGDRSRWCGGDLFAGQLADRAVELGEIDVLIGIEPDAVHVERTLEGFVARKMRELPAVARA